MAGGWIGRAAGATVVGLFVAAAAAMLTAATAAGARAELLVGVAGPLTGRYQARGLEAQIGTELAVAELNAAGGVLGEPVQVVTADDACDPDQAVAVARGLAARGVVLVVGHSCSGAAIAAAPVYVEARIVQISPSATNPRLTTAGWPTVFRVSGRDDQQGAMAGDYLARRWGGARIAILHDGTTYGRGLAEETRARLRADGATEALFLAYAPAAVDFSHEAARLVEAGIDAVYIGGRETEAALIVLQARAAGSDAAVVAGDALVSDDFWLIAGQAADGAVFTFAPDPAATPAAAAVVERLRAQGLLGPVGYTLHAYAAVQAWAQAADHAGTTASGAVAEALRRHAFDTVLGTIGFDANGDVTGIPTYVWYTWQDGDYRELP